MAATSWTNTKLKYKYLIYLGKMIHKKSDKPLTNYQRDQYYLKTWRTVFDIKHWISDFSNHGHSLGFKSKVFKPGRQLDEIKD